jgi:endo-1,4-beta-xylanase
VGAWLGAPAGLVRADGTTKPSYDALRALVKGEWWLDTTTAVTDDEGRVRVSGWLGEYSLHAAGAPATFALTEPGTTDVQVRLPATP